MKTNKNLLKEISKVIELEDNSCLVDLYGEHDENLSKLENNFGIHISYRGNILEFRGESEPCLEASQLVLKVYKKLLSGEKINSEMFDNFSKKDINKIILSRPAVEAGERLGFLPGDLKEKIDPYLRPLYDAMNDLIPEKTLEKYIESNIIEIAPLAFMRGRTLENAFIILDEAQNTSSMQMKMFLTRLGKNSSMVVVGDTTQIDLPRGEKSGLSEILEIMPKTNDIGQVHFKNKDITRHSLVTKIVKAYESNQRETKR